jgi:outer membrane protein insertion porin family
LLVVGALLAMAGRAHAQQVPGVGGERVVRDLKFAGNRALDDYTLASVIATTNSGWFARYWLVRWIGLGEKRYFDEIEFRRDVVRLLIFYKQSGYMEAAVDTVVRRSPEAVWITFRIYEGRPVRVTSLLVSGVSGVLDSTDLARDLPLQIGDPFNRYLMQVSADTIVNRLRVRGYPYARIFRSFDSNEETREASISFEADLGPRSRVEGIDISGNYRVDTSVVRRMLSIRAGDLFNLDRIYQSQRDLYRMDVFRYASVSLLDSAPSGPADTMVRLGVVVSEGDRYRVRTGAGYGTIDCFRAQVGWTARNLFGGARTFDLSTRVSKLGVGAPANAGFENNILCQALHDDTTAFRLNYNVTASLRQPWLFSPRNVATLSVFAERRSEPKAYVRQAVGGSFSVTRETRSGFPVTLAYNLSYGRTTANAAKYCAFFVVCNVADQAFLAEARLLASVTASAARVRVNNPLDPSRGSLITLDLMHTSRLVGSDPDFEFNRGLFEIARYLPIGRRSVLAGRFRGGVILPQRISLGGQSLRFVPPEQRFYAGGPNTVRGFERNVMGPVVYVVTDSTDSTFAGAVAAPTGGNALALANIEVRVPSPILPARLQLAAFVDAGRLWERGDTLVTTRGFRVTPGVGIRFATPLGPVRIDVAYNGYDFERGPLYFRNDVSGAFQLIQTDFQPTRSEGFFRRLKGQVAVGQAF